MIPLPQLRTARTMIRLAELDDAPALLRYRCENREHFAPWEPSREEAYYTLEACQRLIVGGRLSALEGQGYPLQVFAPDEQRILGSFTLAHVVRGPFQACLLGYGMAADQQGRGLMHEALEAGLDWTFGTLGLHRVMANYMPQNERSGRLLQRLGFEREGLARAYLQIAGRWENHVLTARIAPA